MTMIDLPALALKSPEPQPEWSPFFQACAKGQLLIERCSQCGETQFYPRGRCITCMGPVEWVEAVGSGKIFSFTIVRVTRDRIFRPLLPYAVALIDLPEGVRMTGLVLTEDLATLKIGADVHVRFATFVDDMQSAYPIWQHDEN